MFVQPNHKIALSSNFTCSLNLGENLETTEQIYLRGCVGTNSVNLKSCFFIRLINTHSQHEALNIELCKYVH